MGGLRWTEIVPIFLVIVLLFGGSRLPQLGSSLGSAIRNFKKSFGGDAEDDKKIADGNASTNTIESTDKQKQS